MENQSGQAEAAQQTVQIAQPTIQDRVFDKFFKPVEVSENPIETEPEAEQSEVEASDDAGEVEETASEDTTPVEEEFEEITWNGENRKLSKAEMRELAQKGFDYTQKTMDVASQRKALEAEREQFQQMAKMREQSINDYSQLYAINAQLQQYQQLNWAELSDNPVEFTKAKEAYRDLRDMANTINSKIEKDQRDFAAKESEAKQKAAMEGEKVLKRDIKNWGREHAKALADFSANTYGFTESELSSVYDPRIIKMMNDAYQFKQLASKKAEGAKKLETLPKVIKPGQSQQAPSKKDIAKRGIKSASGDRAKAAAIQNYLMETL